MSANKTRVQGRIIPFTVSTVGSEAVDAVIKFLEAHQGGSIDDVFEIALFPEEIVVYSYSKDADGNRIATADEKHLVFETQSIEYRDDYDYSQVTGLLTKLED